MNFEHRGNYITDTLTGNVRFKRGPHAMEGVYGNRSVENYTDGTGWL